MSKRSARSISWRSSTSWRGRRRPSSRTSCGRRMSTHPRLLHGSATQLARAGPRFSRCSPQSSCSVVSERSLGSECDRSHVHRRSGPRCRWRRSQRRAITNSAGASRRESPSSEIRRRRRSPHPRLLSQTPRSRPRPSRRVRPDRRAPSRLRPRERGGSPERHLRRKRRALRSARLGRPRPPRVERKSAQPAERPSRIFSHAGPVTRSPTARANAIL